MKYDTFDTKVAEELSPICKDLFWFMHGLNPSGLEWDTNEVLEALEDVIKLEAVVKAIELDSVRLELFSEHILEDPPLYELEVSAMLKRLAVAISDLEAHDEHSKV